MLKEINRLRDAYRYGLSVKDPKDLIAALELRNLLTVGELVAMACLSRKESRGEHYREDYPECNLQDPARAVGLNRTEDGSIRTQEMIIDPLWRFYEEGLGSGRWG